MRHVGWYSVNASGHLSQNNSPISCCLHFVHIDSAAFILWSISAGGLIAGVVVPIHVGGVCGNDSMRLSTPMALVRMASWSIFGGHDDFVSVVGGHNVSVSSLPM